MIENSSALFHGVDLTGKRTRLRRQSGPDLCGPVLIVLVWLSQLSRRSDVQGESRPQW